MAKQPKANKASTPSGSAIDKDSPRKRRVQVKHASVLDIYLRHHNRLPIRCLNRAIRHVTQKAGQNSSIAVK